MFGKNLWRIVIVFVLILGTLVNTRHVQAEAHADDGVCPSAPGRLKQGDIAVVTVPSDDSLNLRVLYSLEDAVIIKIPPYAYVTIIAGPICNEGYRWFEVGYQGQDGWSAEVGPDGVYNLIPNGQPIPNQSNSVWTVVPGSPTPFIHMGGQYYLVDIINTQLRRVPNQRTLDALNPSPGDVADTDSYGMPIGPDLPDVNTDPSGFCAFKNENFPNNPNPSWSPCNGVANEPLPTVVPTQVLQPTAVPSKLAQDSEFEPDGAEIPGSFWDFMSVKADEFRQWCTEYAYRLRSDIAKWLGTMPNASQWDDRARADGAQYGVYVNPPIANTPANKKDIHAGDIVVWNPYCGSGVGSAGHVGKVLTDGLDSKGRITVTDANHSHKASEVSDLPADLQKDWAVSQWVRRDDQGNIVGYFDGISYSKTYYPFQDCMAFIHEPTANGQQNQDQTKSSPSPFQFIIDWWNSFWRK